MNRFWSKVNKRGPDECWVWQGAKDGSGYGKLMTGSRRDGSRKLASAHRLAYMFAYGPISESVVIRHRCDNPRCVNPAHLLAGTHADNTADKVHRGRMRVYRGAKHHNTQLTELQVRRIRIVDGALPDTFFAGVYGVSKQVIGRARSGKTWSHLTENKYDDK